MSQSIGWERAVLGTVLSDPAAMEAAEDLMPSDFTGAHRTLWSEMVALHRRDALDTRLLIENLRANNQLDEITTIDAELSGERYIDWLLSFRGDRIEEYASGVLDAAVKRQLRMVAAVIAADADAEHVSAEEALDQAERRLISLRRDRSGAEVDTIGDLVGVFLDRVDGMRAGTIEPAWVPNIPEIRSVLGYVDDVDFVILAARPGQGKSSIMRYEWLMDAQKGIPVLLFNLENGDLEYPKFMLSLLTGIDSEALKDPRRLSEEQLFRLRERAQEMARLPIYLKAMAAPSVNDMERVVRPLIRKGIKRIGVDYIQLVKNGVENQVQDVTISSNSLRAWAMRYKIPVVAAAQMNRSIEHRGEDAEPQLSDLRESGSLEQDGTIIMFPRKVWPNPTDAQLRRFDMNIDPETGQLYETPKAEPIRVYVRKNRNGGVGRTRPFLWVLSTNNFLPLQEM